MKQKITLILAYAGCVLSILLMRLHFVFLIPSLILVLELFCRANRYLKASQTDALTGLSNLHQLDRRRQHYRKSHSLTVVYIDLNELKQINNTQGHMAGNAVLAEVGAFLRQLCRKKEAAYRIGGDEFLLISESADPAELLHRFILAQEVLGHISISFGIATGSGQDLDALIHAADQNMYAMKNGTK